MEPDRRLDAETATLDVSNTVNTDNEKQTPVYSPPQIPDGGATAWATVAGAWLILFCSFGYVNAFGVYQDYYTRIYMTNKTSSEIAWIGSTQLCLQFLMGLVSGKLFDEGYFHTTVGFGSLLYVFCLFMLSLAKEGQYYQVFLPQAIGLGIALGLLFLPSIGVISHHFARRRSLAMGIVVSGSSCGGIIFPIMLNKVFERHGFGWGVRSTAFVVLACLIVANLLMRTRLPPKSKRPPTPPPDFKAIMTDLTYLAATAGAFLVMMGLFLPIFYIQLFAVVHGIDETLAFYSLAILNAASIFGRTIPNFIADKLGPFNLLIPCSAISGALIFAMFGIKSSGALIIFSILYGFFSGAYVSLISPVIISLANGFHEIGIRLGLAFAIVGFAALTGTPIAGALLTRELIWWRPIVFSAIIVLSGCMMLCIARGIQAKRKGTGLV
ncbi:putative transporter MCH4 [Saccharomyces cerevisiae S288c] [Rhizoctonia solani]|uniref:Putative transporter MCH4 [Saccharomyces cerevisiae S288c] n=1 Tax=Rhizoctonia solani TaxID=456999 RepID=A0A0K6GAQ4_9AGAM|nr:putative transporter MCH4 [Saccharomyces cerevisiae S288c] [Rhizoctonia solani]